MKIAVLGCGNMSTPIVERIFESEPTLKFYTYTPSQTKAMELAKKVNGVHVKDILQFPSVDFVLIACKPQQFADLLNIMPEHLKSAHIISIMAGISIQRIQIGVGHDNIVRVMPNTPVKLGYGISLIYGKDNGVVRSWFNYCGMTIEVESEKQFNELTTFTGSAPAYIFKFAQSYFIKLRELNQDEQSARDIVASMFLGASLLMNAGPSIPLEDLIRQVTSKAGVTEAALKVLNNNGVLDHLVSDSIDHAIARSIELSKL